MRGCHRLHQSPILGLTKLVALFVPNCVLHSETCPSMQQSSLLFMAAHFLDGSVTPLLMETVRWVQGFATKTRLQLTFFLSPPVCFPRDNGWILIMSNHFPSLSLVSPW